MPTYKDWELYKVLPPGWKIDKHCGSPLFGYDFCTDGKSIINGGKRGLVKTETKKAIMKEFHSDNLHLFNCDNIELMKTFKDKEFDLAIVDPPYGISVNMNAGRKKDTKSKKRTTKKWDNQVPPDEYFLELFRVSKNQIIFGANHMIDKIKKNSQGWIFWDKCVAAGCSFSDGELAWTSFDCALKKIIVPWSGFIGMEGEKFHPTTKPIMLYEKIINEYAKPNFKILDTHFGSGSHGIAIEKANTLDKMNLSLTAIELDEEYFDKSVERIKVFKMQKTLF